jgi:hypothetical protein
MDLDQLRRRSIYLRQIARAANDETSRETALYLADEYEKEA